MFHENINFHSQFNHIFFDYTHPNSLNKKFLAIDWLSEHFFNLIDVETFYNILIRILAEQSFIFVSENIQFLTATVLGFSYLVKPFKWPFIIIPNLPLDLMSMVESPVPFLIGILGNDELKKSLMSNIHIDHCNFVYISENKIELNVIII
jgi:hypothetical protein